MFCNLLKLHIRQQKNNTVGEKNRAVWLFSCLFLLVFLAVVVGSMYMAARAFYKLRFGGEFLTAVFFILQIILVVSSLSAILKNLYMSDDDMLLFKLPVKKDMIFLSKITFIFLEQFFLSLCYVMLTAGVYGIVSGQNLAYFLLLPVVSLLATLFALGVSGMLSVPTVYVVNYIKPRFWAKMLVLTIVTFVFFSLYMVFMNKVVDIVNITKTGGYIPVETVENIKASTKWMYISAFLMKITVGLSAGLSFTIYLFISAALCVGAFFLTKLFYFKAQAERNEYAVHKKTGKFVCNTPFSSFFKKELLTIFRIDATSAQIFFMGLSMPIMVFFTIKMTAAAGSSQIGEQIVFGVCVLTVFSFLTMCDSLSASAYSRDGAANYLANVLPYDKKKQLFVKILIGFIISGAPFMASIVTLAVAKYVSIAEFFALMTTGLIFIFAHISDSVMRDRKNPSYSEYSNNIDNKKNVALSIASGLAFVAVIGTATLILSYTSTFAAVCGVCIGSSLLYALFVFLYRLFDERRICV